MRSYLARSSEGWRNAGHSPARCLAGVFVAYVSEDLLTLHI
ncbi:hypothetical protein [Allochromatium palmeri]|nr:hypothetical protein [Allochromatium palmeri]